MLTRTHGIVAASTALLTLAAVAVWQGTPSADAQIEIRFGDEKPAPAAQAPTPKPLTTKDISADQAQRILRAAIAKAEQIDTKMDIAVVDAGGNLKAFLRMDGAWLGSIDIAIKKAKTARYFDMPTGEIGKLSKEDGPLYNILKLTDLRPP